jgi:hypothetical protein
LSGSDPSKNDSIRKEIARQVRSLFKDQRLRIPGRINLIGDLILSPVLLALAAKPVILELLSGVTVNLPWLRYSGQSDLSRLLETLLWIAIFITVWVGCIIAFTDYRRFGEDD